jgi:5'-methylthioadenosine phosphorylase
MVGIIGGSGLYEIEGVIIKETRKISTPFGDPSGSYVIGEFSGLKVAFLARHGSRHQIPPHRINYRANIWGFKALGVERVLSVGATGGISQGMAPGTIVIPDQIIDMTRRRDVTFYDGEEVVHIDFTAPFCSEVRGSLFTAGERAGIDLRKSGTYVCAEGPRLETKAEIQFFSHIGGDVVGMTFMPEASLAREAELCYGGIAIITNFAAGIKAKGLTATEVIDVMNEAMASLRRLLRETLSMLPGERSCGCKDALREARV